MNASIIDMTKMGNIETIAVIGLGYVGLPLALAFNEKYSVIGYDVDSNRIDELQIGIDKNNELNSEQLVSLKSLELTSSAAHLLNIDCFIVTVPTPVNTNNSPDLTLLLSATKLIGNILQKGNFVIYESTVFPGATEDICVPVLEKESGLIYNKDFFCGYSPERINPGDVNNTLKNIVKVVSGSNGDALNVIADLYCKVVDAGVHRAPSIKVAEAAKVIENTQRDINVALMNELSIIFDKLELNTWEVIEAAKTKWNFLPFEPGLVGGHCIGIDPYYLLHCAQTHGYHPEMIISGRRINDGMASYVATSLLKLLHSKEINSNNAKVLIMGVTFKENCSDIRNSQVIKMVDELKNYGCLIDIFDPRADQRELKISTGLTLCKKPQLGDYDAIVIAVKHREFLSMTHQQIRSFGKPACVIYDLKNMLEPGWANKTL